MITKQLLLGSNNLRCLLACIACLQDCAAFSMPPPDFSSLEATAADIAATHAAWSRYGDFLKERNDLAHGDWLSMRDQVGPVDLLNCCLHATVLCQLLPDAS